MKRFVLIILLFLAVSQARAGKVDTILIYSNAMHKDFKCVVITPNSYNKRKSVFPVLYLLHGYAGDFSNWIKKMPSLKEEVDELQMIIVCPEGGWSSWYFDSPIDSTMRYETYIAKEVPGYIDAHYRTIKDRKARAITGLSMGGHGSFFIAFRHPDVFGACGSMSGLMDLWSTINKYDLVKRIGDTVSQKANWRDFSVINIVERYRTDSLNITFDCGTDDGFFADNRKLHEKMLMLKIKHDYAERPGNHSWAYWTNSLQYHLLFFKNFFQRSKK